VLVAAVTLSSIVFHKVSAGLSRCTIRLWWRCNNLLTLNHSYRMLSLHLVSFESCSLQPSRDLSLTSHVHLHTRLKRRNRVWNNASDYSRSINVLSNRYMVTRSRYLWVCCLKVTSWLVEIQAGCLLQRRVFLWFWWDEQRYLYFVERVTTTFTKASFMYLPAWITSWRKIIDVELLIPNINCNCLAYAVFTFFTITRKARNTRFDSPRRRDYVVNGTVSSSLSNKQKSKRYHTTAYNCIIPALWRYVLIDFWVHLSLCWILTKY